MFYYNRYAILKIREEIKEIDMYTLTVTWNDGSQTRYVGSLDQVLRGMKVVRSIEHTSYTLSDGLYDGIKV